MKQSGLSSVENEGAVAHFIERVELSGKIHVFVSLSGSGKTAGKLLRVYYRSDMLRNTLELMSVFFVALQSEHGAVEQSISC